MIKICTAIVLGLMLSGCELLTGSSGGYYYPAPAYPSPPVSRDYDDLAKRYRDYRVQKPTPVDLKAAARRARIEYESSAENQKNYDLLKKNMHSRFPDLKEPAQDSKNAVELKTDTAVTTEKSIENGSNAPAYLNSQGDAPSSFFGKGCMLFS